MAQFPLPKFTPRTRREVNQTDSINARQFEHWQTDGKYETLNRPDTNKRAPFQDELPNNSRMNDRSYRSQPRFDVELEKGGYNPYFDKYKVTKKKLGKEKTIINIDDIPCYI